MIRFGMPRHAGPHRQYKGLAIEPVGRIGSAWTVRCSAEFKPAPSDGVIAEMDA